MSSCSGPSRRCAASSPTRRWRRRPAGAGPAGLRGQGRRGDAGARDERGRASLDLDPDLPDAVERLSEVTAVKSVGKQADRSPTSLFAFAETVTANPELRDALANPAVRSRTSRRCSTPCSRARRCRRRSPSPSRPSVAPIRTITAALAAYRQVAAQVHGEVVATVRVVQPLSDGDRGRLTKALSQYGRQVHLNEIVDPDVLGGLRVEIGDDVIDGTVSSRLDRCSPKLAG